MREMFQGYYQPTEPDLDILREHGLIVFDTNVLLNLYRYRNSTRERLFKEVKKHNQRVWIPFHVGLEFHRNRLKVISEQNDKSPKFREIVDAHLSKIEGSVGNLNLKKKHSFIDPDGLISGLKKVRDDFFEKVDNDENNYNPVKGGNQDPILDEVNDCFSGRIGAAPKDQNVIDDISHEGEKRYLDKIPPGFEDASKGDENDLFHYGGIAYQRKFGDLIIWKQLIEFVKENSIKDVIFVTEDEKKDWWWVSDWGKKEIIGARPELVEEISREAGVSRFYLCNTVQFIQLLAEPESSDETNDVIEDVRNVAAERLAKVAQSNEANMFEAESRMSRVNRFHRRKQAVNKAVIEHVLRDFSEVRENEDDFPAFYSLYEGEKFGFHVSMSGSVISAQMKLKELIFQSFHALIENDFSLITIYICIDEKSSERAGELDIFYRRAIKLLRSAKGNILLRVGTVRNLSNNSEIPPEFEEQISISDFGEQLSIGL